MQKRMNLATKLETAAATIQAKTNVKLAKVSKHKAAAASKPASHVAPPPRWRVGDPVDAGDWLDSAVRPLPAGWRAVPSESHPGTWSYVNAHTGEKIAWVPTAPASVEPGHLPPPPGMLPPGWREGDERRARASKMKSPSAAPAVAANATGDEAADIARALAASEDTFTSDRQRRLQVQAHLAALQSAAPDRIGRALFGAEARKRAREQFDDPTRVPRAAEAAHPFDFLLPHAAVANAAEARQHSSLGGTKASHAEAQRGMSEKERLYGQIYALAQARRIALPIGLSVNSKLKALRSWRDKLKKRRVEH